MALIRCDFFSDVLQLGTSMTVLLPQASEEQIGAETTTRSGPPPVLYLLHGLSDDDSAWLRTCSVITTEATDAAGHIHDRMPMVITREAIDAWLDPTITNPKHALELLAVTEAAALEAYAVSTDVNSVENNDPSLVEPITAEPEPESEPDQETLI